MRICISLFHSAIVNAQVDNLQVRPTRRTNFTIGVTYDTSSEKLNFEIKRRFENEGIEMAYPTQTVHLVKKAASGD